MSEKIKENLKLIKWTESNEILSETKILLSTSDYEGMPLIMLEAISLKTIVISKKIMGVEEIFDKSDYKDLLLWKSENDCLDRVKKIINNKSLIVKISADLYNLYHSNYNSEIRFNSVKKHLKL